jgi:hypothetical protein
MADTKSFDGGLLAMFNPVKEFEVIEGVVVKARALHVEDFVEIKTEFPDIGNDLRLAEDSDVPSIELFAFVCWLGIREDTRVEVKNAAGEKGEVEISKDMMRKIVNNRTIEAWREVWEWVTDTTDDDTADDGTEQGSEIASKN